MFEIRQTPEYEKWFVSLKDRTARVRVDIRIRRMSLGNLGVVEPVGEGVSELKIDHGPGYRVYFVQHRNFYVLLLVGGDKSTQARDIKKAKELAQKYGVLS
ncbi:type II toxin-antitoxin system RelE/ParE family toxin [soil metagenome]